MREEWKHFLNRNGYLIELCNASYDEIRNSDDIISFKEVPENKIEEFNVDKDSIKNKRFKTSIKSKI